MWKTHTSIVSEGLVENRAGNGSFFFRDLMKMVEKHWIWLYILSSVLEEIPRYHCIGCKGQTSREVRVSVTCIKDITKWSGK